MKNPISLIIHNRLYRQFALAVLSLILCISLVFAITTAWYSNVIHSNSLNFEAAPWGFEGSVTIGTDIITAAPGSRGTIPITVTNPTDQIISMKVNISKSQISDFDIQKRIYFYADETVTENGEIIDKVYINKLNNYDYTLLGGQEFVSGTEKNNSTQIKWEWVYDVLGYYVLGKIDPERGSMITEDYLRPVEYDYDQATFDEDGNLLTVDGKKTVEEFLSELTAADGYEGVIDIGAVRDGYYPIDLDENGYGVWLYLCSRGEIEYLMTVDTMLGAAAAETAGNASQFSAVLNIIGQQKKLNITEVRTSDAFALAFEDEACDMIKLTSDISASRPVRVPSDKEMIVDLNGYTLTSSVTGELITAEHGSAISVINGTIKGEGSQKYAIYTNGAQLSLIDVNISDMYNAVYIKDRDGNKNDSRVFISGCDITCENAAVIIIGNGRETERMTRLSIDNTKLVSEKYIGLTGDGSTGGDGSWGTDILISNSNISGYYGGIYQPQQDSYMKIVDSEITGYTPIAVKGGEMLIENCKITAKDEKGDIYPTPPQFTAGGYTDTGDGVYVETNYKWSISVTITGENTLITSEEGTAVRMYEPDAANALITITGGSYDSDVSEFLVADEYECIYGGEYYTVRKKQ